MSTHAPLWRLAKAVARHDPLADLLPQLHDQALQVSGGRSCVLLRLDPRTGQFQAVSAVGLHRLEADGWLSDRAGRTAADRTWAEGAPRAFANLPRIAERLHSKATMLVPLVSRSERLGLLVIGVDDVAHAKAASGEISAVGDLLAVALECARLQRDADLQRDLRELVAELTRAVSSSLNLNASLALFCDRSRRLFNATSVEVWLHDRRARMLDLFASSEPSDVAVRRRVASDDPTVHVSRAMRRTQAMLVPGTGEAPPDVLLPLKGSRRALGTLAITGVRFESADEIDLLDRLEEVARQLSGAIENVLLLEDVLRSRRELESTFNSMADLVAVCDSELKIVHANRAFATRGGRRPADLAGHPLSDFFGPELIAWVARLRRAADPGAPSYESRELKDPVLGGSFLFTLSPLLGRENEHIGTVIVARDVTEQARLEAERVELRDRLTQSEKLAALGQFVAGIAHELNNPLQGVLGHVELMLQDTAPGSARFKRDLKVVLREADRAAKTVHDLLVFAGSRRITRRRLNVNHVITRVLALRATACAAASIDVSTDLAAKLPRVQGDALLLQQALLNIVVNAEQALSGMPLPRKLELRTRTAGRRAIEIQISDNGPGIPPDALPRLFEPFFTTKEVGQGTGLGLAIAYGIVQEHDGRLQAGNRSGGGAVFTLELPSG